MAVMLQQATAAREGVAAPRPARDEAGEAFVAEPAAWGLALSARFPVAFPPAVTGAVALAEVDNRPHTTCPDRQS